MQHFNWFLFTSLQDCAILNIQNNILEKGDETQMDINAIIEFVMSILANIGITEEQISTALGPVIEFVGSLISGIGG